MLSWFAAIATLALLAGTASTQPQCSNSNPRVISPTDSLQEALEDLESDTTLQLLPGSYTLDRYQPVLNLSNICITGYGNMTINTTITCSENVGLAFVNIRNLVISNIAVRGCGLSQSNLEHALSEVKRYINLLFVVYSEMRFAVFLGHCEDVWIAYTEVSDNEGFGLVGINMIGTSMVTNLTAINNTQPSDCIHDRRNLTVLSDPLFYAGGAVFLFQDYLPAFDRIDILTNQLTITNSAFERNSECSFNYFDYVRAVGDSSYLRGLGYRIGGSSGLNLQLSQLNFGVEIYVASTYFEGNTATFGASSQITMLAGVRNTRIEYDNCTFFQNGAVQELGINDRTQVGAGLGIVTDLRRLDDYDAMLPGVLNTSISVINSNFTENVCNFSAGLIFYPAHWSPVSDLTDVLYFYIRNTSFINNTALVAPAMQLWEYKYSGASIGAQVQLSDIQVLNNTIVSVNSDNSQSPIQSSGVIDIRSLNVTFDGDCFIEDNSGTALRAEQSYVGIIGNVRFANNIGIIGGAMHLFSYSYLIVLPNASLNLLSNQARVSGGGIYSNLIGSNTYLSGGAADCFLFFGYDDFGFCEECSDLDELGIYIKLEDNTAPTGGQIFGSAFRSCPWAVDLLLEYGEEKDDNVLAILNLTYPSVFDIVDFEIKPSSFQTQSLKLEIVDPNNASNPLDPNEKTLFVLPGQVFNTSIQVTDNFDQIVSNVISSFVSAEVDLISNNATSQIGSNNFGVLRPNMPTEIPLTITGAEGQELNVILYSTDSNGRAFSEFRVNLGFCGDAFVFDNQTRRCSCISELENLGIICDAENVTLASPDARWVGYTDRNNSIIGVANCELLNCLFGDTKIFFSNGVGDFDSQCDPRLFKSGVLCGECENGTSFVLGTSRCLECSNFYIFLFPVFLALGLIMIILIYYFDITITEGLLNGAIFFSNLVTLYSAYLFPADLGGANYIFIVSFLSLNFGIETCLYDGMGALDKLWWQLSFPIYLFILMGIISIITAYTSYLKVLSKANNLSIVRAFATLMLLCYVSVLEVCVAALAHVVIDTINGDGERVAVTRWVNDPSIEYFQGTHAIFALIAILIIVVYVIPFPLFLLFPTLVYKSRLLRQLKPFYDAFWHPYKPKFRFWLAMRLIVRWVIFALGVFTAIPNNVFYTALVLILLLFVQTLFKPYEKEFTNTIDSLFLLILIFMFTGTLYFSALSESVEDTFFDRHVTSYNLAFTVVGFLCMLFVFTYHIVLRVPKLNAFVKKVLAKLRLKEGSQFVPTLPEEEISTEREDTDSRKSNTTDSKTTTSEVTITETLTPPTTVVTSTVLSFTELREPLLDDDGAGIVLTSAKNTTNP